MGVGRLCDLDGKKEDTEQPRHYMSDCWRETLHFSDYNQLFFLSIFEESRSIVQLSVCSQVNLASLSSYFNPTA